LSGSVWPGRASNTNSGERPMPQMMSVSRWPLITATRLSPRRSLFASAKDSLTTACRRSSGSGSRPWRMKT